MDSELTSITEKLVKAWSFFYKRGFVDGFGHISARVRSNDHFLLSRHALTSKVSADDFTLLVLAGNCMSPQLALPAELPTHLEIYKRRHDVTSIAHFHCLFSTSFTMSDISLKPAHFLASIFRTGIRVHPNSRLISDAEPGSALAKTLGKCRAALLKAHGVSLPVPMLKKCWQEPSSSRTMLIARGLSRAWGSCRFLDEDTMAEIEADILRSTGAFRRIWALCEEDASKE